MEVRPPVTLAEWLDLRDDMRATELLLEDVQIDPADLATYWAMSAELLALLQEIGEYLEQRGLAGPTAEDATLYLSKRRRLVALLAKAQEIGIETAPEPG